MKKTVLFLFLAASCSIFSCGTDENPTKVEVLELPSASYQYDASESNEMATLGRVLFYDRSLSVNNSLSCASCHKQSLAFADNVAFSVGFENRVTRRNSMPIQNLQTGRFDDGGIATFGSFLFWDGRESELSSMVLKPIANHVEMGIGDFDKLSKKLEGTSYYSKLFSDAYGSTEVTSDKVAQALSSFLRNISSMQSKFDKALAGAGQLTALEQKGQDLFMTVYDCNQCHQIQTPHGYEFAGTFANIGLDAEYKDVGREEVTNFRFDNGRFKIPSLRNVALTAPYMHDGRFENLDEVLEHYSDGIANNEALDPRLRTKTGDPMRFNIPESDRKAIIAFLNTLTDQGMITDVRFSNPFKAK
jgi:cytochrome c peroxidase